MNSFSVLLPNGIPVTCPSVQGVLLLAATNIRFGKYKDDQGEEKRGWTAALSMMVGGDHEKKKAFKVHAGKSVQFDKFIVKVLRIDKSRAGMVVLASVSGGE